MYTPGPFKGKVGLYLAANKSSLKIDPIDWDTLTGDIKRWSQTACQKSVMICKSTLEKFSERIQLQYNPRVPSYPRHTQSTIRVQSTITMTLVSNRPMNLSILKSMSETRITCGY